MYFPLYAGAMARSIHRREGSSQTDAYPRRRTRFPPFPLPKQALCIPHSTFWSKNQCLALGKSFRCHPSITPQIPIFRHAAWVYVDDFFFLFPESTAKIQYTLAIVLLRVLGTPLSWKKLEFDETIEWNGWAIQPMLARLPSFKQEKITALITSLREHPSRKGLEKIIGIILWATSMVHHTRFLLTSLYRDLYSIPATNYSIEPTRWQEFLCALNEDAIISQKNKLHFPVGSRVVDFQHQPITSKSQLPKDVSIERHAWVRLRDPLTDKRKLSTESQNTLSCYLCFTPSLSTDAVT